MMPGRMDKRINLIEMVKTADGAGGFKTVATSRGIVWSEFKKPDLKTEVVAGAISSVLIKEIGIRYRTDIRKGWQVLYGLNRTFTVEHTYDYGKTATILVCKEVIK